LSQLPRTLADVQDDSDCFIDVGHVAAGEVAGGMHGSNRLGGNSLSDLLVFGRRAGLGASTYVDGLAILLVALICPLLMGGMMFFMMRGMRGDRGAARADEHREEPR